MTRVMSAMGILLTMAIPFSFLFWRMTSARYHIVGDYDETLTWRQAGDAVEDHGVEWECSIMLPWLNDRQAVKTSMGSITMDIGRLASFA